MAIIGQDPEFGTNHFNTAKYKTESQTIIDNIVTILFGIPGFFPSIPNLGMNIQSYLYQFWDTIDTNVLKAELISQCEILDIFLRDNTLDIIKTTNDIGQPLLLIVMPVLIEGSDDKVTIKITKNENGNIDYNYGFNNE